MKDKQYWITGIEEYERYPHEALDKSIEGLKDILETLRSIKPKKDIDDEINSHIEEALNVFAKESFISAEIISGKFKLYLADDISRELTMNEIIESITQWISNPSALEDWAIEFENAAKTIRGSILKK